MGQGLDLFSLREINEYRKFIKKFKEKTLSTKQNLLSSFVIEDKKTPQLLKAHGVGIGCLMIRRDVLETVPFRTHPTYIIGEDCWFFNECEDKKIEIYLDAEIKPKHKHTHWNMILEKSMAHKNFNATLCAEKIE